MHARTRAMVLVAAVATAIVATAGCGGATVTQSPDPLPSSAPVGSGAPASGITVTRTGGIAGMHDEVVIAADGSAHVTPKSGVMSVCTPSQESIDRIRAMDLSALGPPPSKTPIMDGFGYDVVTDTGRASVGDGDTGAHGELLVAAAEVVSSCLATMEPPSA